jgi:DNA-binding transcriptional regulator YiaG
VLRWPSVPGVNELWDLIDARRRARSGEGRRLREAAGLSLRELAAQVGVDAATLDRWERGLARPRRAAALRYQTVLAALAELSGSVPRDDHKEE